MQQQVQVFFTYPEAKQRIVENIMIGNRCNSCWGQQGRYSVVHISSSVNFTQQHAIENDPKHMIQWKYHLSFIHFTVIVYQSGGLRKCHSVIELLHQNGFNMTFSSQMAIWSYYLFVKMKVRLYTSCCCPYNGQFNYPVGLYALVYFFLLLLFQQSPIKTVFRWCKP